MAVASVVTHSTDCPRLLSGTDRPGLQAATTDNGRLCIARLARIRTRRPESKSTARRVSGACRLIVLSVACNKANKPISLVCIYIPSRSLIKYNGIKPVQCLCPTLDPVSIVDPCRASPNSNHMQALSLTTQNALLPLSRPPIPLTRSRIIASTNQSSALTAKPAM